MPTGLVLVEVGTGIILYRNATAEGLGFAYGEEPAQVYDATGVRKDDASLPHAVAARGQPVPPELLELRRPGHPSVWLIVRSRQLGHACVLTFEDVSALHAEEVELRAGILARDELVSMASHELRSPVGALALALEQICRKAGHAGAADLQKLAVLGGPPGPPPDGADRQPARRQPPARGAVRARSGAHEARRRRARGVRRARGSGPRRGRAARGRRRVRRPRRGGTPTACTRSWSTS